MGRFRDGLRDGLVSWLRRDRGERPEPAGPPVLPRLVLPLYGGGVLLSVLYALPLGWRDGVRVAIVAISAGTAAYFAGGFLGFLFGIPRSAGDAERPATEGGYRANTNLEQISDWLTKILVGVGLIQLGQIGSGGRELVDYVATGLGDHPGSRPFTLALLVAYAVGGFLVGYLYTRTTLPRAFHQADLAALEDRVKQAEEVSRQAVATSEKVERDLRDQAERDARLLALVESQLEAGEGEVPEVPLDELRAAAVGASQSARLAALERARGHRKAKWRADKPAMARSIPVFRALAEAETEESHWVHGQLGFALRDQPVPDPAAAEAELTEAIDLRGDWRVNGWLYYELNRAQARIMQDENYRRDTPASAGVRSDVVADVFVAAHNESALRVLRTDGEFTNWFTLNGVDPAGLPESALAPPKPTPPRERTTARRTRGPTRPGGGPR